MTSVLAHWGMQGAPLHLIAQRENRVFRVDAFGRRYALRQHRAGLRDAAALQSELWFMAMLAAGGLNVPRPVPAQSGALTLQHDGLYFDLLTWIDGAPMGVNGQRAALDDLPGTYRALGRAMAQLHDLADDWIPPGEFTRPHWNAAGLLGDRPLWGRFWDNPHLSGAQAQMLCAARDVALRSLPKSADYGLIHADLVCENVMCSTPLALIDFDDCGYGYRLFDLATVLLRAAREPDYPTARAAFLQGYMSRRALDLTYLQFFVALRAFTYVGWVLTRLDEPGADARAQRLITIALAHADFLLNDPKGRP